MIAFGSSLTAPEIYERYAQPGIRRAAEPDSAVFVLQAAGSLFASYNLILERAAACADLEALVLVHQDAEIDDPELCAKLRRTLADPAIGVIGCVGIVGARSMAWWEGTVTWGSGVYRHYTAGDDELPALAFNGDRMPPQVRTGDVDMVDGFMLALSPWVVRNIRFDESLGQLYGYDFDVCQQVRAAGRRVVAEDLRVIHHHSLALVSDNEPWVAAHMRVAEKWDGRIPGAGARDEDWERRGRRAEAEAGVARLLVASRQYQGQAAAIEHEQRLKAVTDTMSWRITAPLRWLNAARRARLGDG